MGRQLSIKNKTMSLKNKTILIYCLFAIFCLILFYIVPYTRDDWAWGSSIGLDRLSVWFADYNGRYGGNIVEIALANFRWLRTIVETGVVIALVCFMTPSGKNRVFFTILAMTFILLEPMIMMRQTLVYTAGFSNYVIPTMFMVMFLKHFGRTTQEQLISEGQNRRLVKTIIISISAFVATLFMEHITLYLMFLSCIVMAFSFYKTRKVYADQIGFFIGTLLGNVLMFSNGAYWNVLSGNDGYRSLGNGADVVQEANPYMEHIGSTLFVENFFFNIVMAISVIIILKRNIPESQNVKNMKLKRLIGYLSSCSIMVMTALISVVHLINLITRSQYGIRMTDGYYMAVIYVILLALCLTILIISTSNSSLRKKLIFLLVSIAVLNAPLLIVNPISPRCFFPTYILLCVFIIQSLQQVKIRKRASVMISSILICSMVGFLIIYFPLHSAETKRVETIRQAAAKGESIIPIKKLPNEEFVWLITPYPGTKWEYRYKKFYDIPEDVTLITGGAK